MAVGFSNGANIAGALLLLRPDVLGTAVLFRAMVPLTPGHAAGHSSDTRADLEREGWTRSCPPRKRNGWPRLLRSAGADVTVAWQNSGSRADRTRRDYRAGMAGAAAGAVTVRSASQR